MSGANHTADLKPCPFCGGALHTERNSAVPGGLVVCHDDGSLNCPLRGRKVPIGKWNTRADNPAAFREVFGELVGAVERAYNGESLCPDDFMEARATLAKAEELTQ